MRNSFILTLTLAVLTIISCGKDEYIPVVVEPQNDQWEIQIQSEYVSPPSKVSVFFKVVDGDDQPVSGLVQDDFTIYEKGRNDAQERLISVDEAKRVISDNGPIFNYHVLLVLDLSGSVTNNTLPELKEASTQFVDEVMNSEINGATKMGIWWFDGADVLHPLTSFTNNAEVLQTAISGIHEFMSTDSSTDLFGAVVKSTLLAQAKITESDLQGYLSAASIVVFTDGTDQAARYSKEDAYAAINNASESISFYTIGLGSEIDEKALNKIGKTSSVFANNTAALTTKFEEIAQLIHDEANSHYLFEYCTPKRDGSGINELHIHVTKGNSTGKKITEFDATGFEDDCDLQ